MLVLSRKKQQRIFVGPDITLTIIEIRGNVVRLGFEAPKDVVITREELAEPFEREARPWPSDRDPRLGDGDGHGRPPG